MNASQKIFRIRRKYNQWVNNQTLEDYSLRFTAKAARKWSLLRVANTALGAISFLALEAIGGAITISYGFNNAAISILLVGFIILLAGIPICYYAAKYGVDIDLLTRGAGFGYIGSTATSLIYASFTFIFFALEAAIMAMALKLLFAIPLGIGYVICSVVVIPIVTYGITTISRFQLWTQPFWILLQLLPFIYILFFGQELTDDWIGFEGLETDGRKQASIIYVGAASAILFSLVAQIGEQVDFLRFLPEKTPKNRFRWWCAMLSAGPGWIIIGVAKLFLGSLLAYLALKDGLSPKDASDPTLMYQLIFEQILGNPVAALALSGIFVILSQLKINVTNAYAGSIAWSNFFSRLTHSHPGRVVWLVFNVAIALLLMEVGLYQAFEITLAAYAIVAVSWVSCLVADLVINKPLNLSPKHIEFRRAYLYDFNPVGVGSMLISTSIGVFCYLGVAGDIAQATAHFITLITAIICVPAIAIITKGKYYLARENDDKLLIKQEIECCICQNNFEKEDMAFCPAYDGPICSLCCSLDSRCQDMCKPKTSLPANIKRLIEHYLPESISSVLNKRLISFGFLFFTISIIIGALMILSFINFKTDNSETNTLINNLLWQVYLILMIISGVVSWLFILANESRHVAQEESNSQNDLLKKEIQAHKKTDEMLEKAKEQAEAANNAKSRYLSGISHELRSPLNSILGYAQLLEADKELIDSKKEKVSFIRRSGEHLANLIEGLLDISQIEAGKLHILRDQVNISQLLDQVVDMFNVQAEKKHLNFTYHCLNTLPTYVATDEKRLRQILINLLSNAIKFTFEGSVNFTVKYKNQVAEFIIEDTGIGIPEDEVDRIFKPFERITDTELPSTQGTGLGLTITQLLTEIMGGDIKVSRNQHGGTTFTVWLMLSDIINPKIEEIETKRIHSYKGSTKTVTVIDDDPTHRSLIRDILSPLGFTVLEAHSGDAAISLHKKGEPDIYLLDISMPIKNGWQVANEIRALGFQKPIIIVSANAIETNESKLYPNLVNDHIIKPIKNNLLIEKIGLLLNLDWNYSDENHSNNNPSNNNPRNNNPRNNNPRNKPITLDKKFISDEEKYHRLNTFKSDNIKILIELAEIGHLSEFKKTLSHMEKSGEFSPATLLKLYTWLKDIRFEKIVRFLKHEQQK